jgi:hypothetical protein
MDAKHSPGIDKSMPDEKFRMGYEFAQRELTDEPQPIREATAREFNRQLGETSANTPLSRMLLGALAYLTEIHEGNQPT